MRIPTGLLLGLVAMTAVAAEQYGAPLTMKTPLTLEAAVQSLDDRACGATCWSNRRSRRSASSAAAGSP